MQKRIPIKNHLQEIQLVTRRCIAAFIIMMILISLLIFRLGFLELARHDLYTTLSKKNWLDLVPSEPTRGLIFDRNGILLAENIPVFSLDILPYKVTTMPQLLIEISKIISLSNADILQFQKMLRQHRRFDEIPLKLRLTEAEVAKFYENQYRFPGALIKARLIRHYPWGGTLSHVLGYVGRINSEDLDDLDNDINYSATNYIGKLGIEKYYEDELHGTVGYEQVENDASGEAVRVLKQINPIPGKTLFLTIDINLQKVAEEALAGSRGAIVIIQPNTGQVLALVSEPTYDPNLFVNGISTEDFKNLQTSIDRPLYNRALRGLYPFGSTIKPFIALEGLDTEVVTTDYTISDPGWYVLPNSKHVFHDWRPHGHGTVNLIKAIEVSCDTYFYGLAHKMGIKRIDDILQRFGFGELTGIDIEEELPGAIASPELKRRTKGVAWYEGDTLNTVIGQGFMQVTPLQLAHGVATIANRGINIVPHVLLAEKDPKKPPQPWTMPPANPITLKDETWGTIIEAMQGVITSPEATGALHFGKNVGYPIAAKTGTAQVFSIKHRNAKGVAEQQKNLPELLRDHSLFIAFAPIDHPQIAIAVVVENSLLAAGIARKVLDYYLIKPKEKNTKEKNTHDTQQ